MKTNVEKLIYSLKRKNPNIHIDDQFQDQTKFYLKRFLTESNRLCSTNQNQSLHSTLRKLRQNENIKICQYDKGNGVVVLNSEDYYSKLDHIIDDPTKFIKVNTDFLFFFILFAIFILHSRESELYRYTLDGKSALA